MASRVQVDGLTRLTLVGAAAVSLVLTFLAMFTVCTQASATLVAGIQGRYFVPMLMALAPAVAGLLPLRGTLLPKIYLVLLSLTAMATVAGLLVAEPLIYPAPRAATPA